MKTDRQSARYQLTINNPLDANMTHDAIKQILVTNFKTLEFFCMVDEQGSCYHTHIFICFTSRVRFSKMKKHFPTAHIEACNGSIKQNVEYLKKSDKWQDTEKKETQIEGTYEEYGNRPPDSKGRNWDMTRLYQMILDGMTNAEIIATNQDYILQIDKLDKLRTTILTDKFKNTRRTDIQVTYIYGSTGSGKSRYVLDKFGDSEVYRVTDYLHPFDGYNCQPVIVFEEYRSSLPLKDILNYLDVYPIELGARYYNKFACYIHVFIISNWKLEKQYSELQKEDTESWEAFLRRIHKVIVMNKDATTVYNSVSEYMNRTSDWIAVKDDDTVPFT